MNEIVNVGKVIGLEGFCNSGKSNTLKGLCKLMLSQKSCQVVKIFQPNGNEDSVSSGVDFGKDICVLLDYCGKTVLIVSGGDYTQLASIVLNIIIKISVRIDVVFAAMRFMFPSVGDEYRKIFGKQGIQVKSIFKPGCKRVDSLPEGVLDWVDSLWVKQLMAEL